MPAAPVTAPTPHPVDIPRSQGDNRINSLPPAEEIKPSQQIVDFVLASGENRTIPHEGNQFYVIAATAAVEIRCKGTAFQSYPARTGRKLASGFFRSLDIRNSSGAPNTVTIALGNDTFIDFRIV